MSETPQRPKLPSSTHEIGYRYSPPHPQALKQSFRLYDPSFELHALSNISATELVRRFDGTVKGGQVLLRAEINESGDKPQQMKATRVTSPASDSELDATEPYLFIASANESPDKAGKWCLKLHTMTELYPDQERPNAIADQVQNEWQEWKSSGTQEDFRTWVGNKRAAMLPSQ